MISRWLFALAPLLFLNACSQEPAEDGPMVLAAASLQESLSHAADEWAGQGHSQPVLSFAGTSSLARQLLNGAPADLFISADEAWMDEVESQDLLRQGTRRDLLANRLVLIAPVKDAQTRGLAPISQLAVALGDGRLAMADPDAVPAGRYGKAALEHLHLWSDVEKRIARAENVRAALALVERGEAPFGIVYATDAAASDKVRVVAAVPEENHPPIRYPIAVLAASDHPEASKFADFLVSDSGQAIFAAYGFEPIP